MSKFEASPNPLRQNPSPWKIMFAPDYPALAFAGFVGFIYFAIWWRARLDPITTNTLAWNGWWDQSQYLRSTLAFSHFNFMPSEHWYPLGYSILGVPFERLIPSEPYLFINLLLTELYSLAFLAFFRPVIGIWPTLVAFIFSMLFPLAMWDPYFIFPVFLQWIIPWNTAPIAALFMTSLVFARHAARLDFARIDYLLGAFVAYGLATRPADVPVLALAAAASLLPRTWKSRSPHHLARAAIGFTIVAAPFAALQFAIYHSAITPYSNVVAQIGASVSQLPFRFYSIFIDAGSTFGESKSVLLMQPWLVATTPLFVLWGIMDRRSGLTALICCTISWASYLAYNDFLPLNAFRFLLFHYIAWTFPVVTAGGIAGAIVLWRSKNWAVGIVTVALPVIAIFSTKIVATAVEVDVTPTGDRSFHLAFKGRQELSAIDFLGAVTQEPIEHATITVDGRTLDLFSGYRIYNMAGGLRLAFRAPVAGSTVDVRLPSTVQNVSADPTTVAPIQFSVIWSPGVPPTATGLRNDKAASTP